MLYVRIAAVEIETAHRKDRRRIEGAQLEAVLERQRRIRENRRKHVVHDARWILGLEREYLADRERIKNAVSAPHDRGITFEGPVRKAKAGREIVPIRQVHGVIVMKAAHWPNLTR